MSKESSVRKEVKDRLKVFSSESNVKLYKINKQREIAIEQNFVVYDLSNPLTFLFFS